MKCYCQCAKQTGNISVVHSLSPMDYKSERFTEVEEALSKFLTLRTLPLNFRTQNLCRNLLELVWGKEKKLCSFSYNDFIIFIFDITSKLFVLIQFYKINDYFLNF